MKKANRKSLSPPGSEHDFASVKGGVRDKYEKRFRAGTKLVLLDPELAAVFPTDDAVNDALRALLRMTELARLPHRGSGQGRHKPRKR